MVSEIGIPAIMAAVFAVVCFQVFDRLFSDRLNTRTRQGKRHQRHQEAA